MRGGTLCSKQVSVMNTYATSSALLNETMQKFFTSEVVLFSVQFGLYSMGVNIINTQQNISLHDKA